MPNFSITSLGVRKTIFLARMAEKGLKKNMVADFKVSGRDPGIPDKKYTGKTTKLIIAPKISIFC